MFQNIEINYPNKRQSVIISTNFDNLVEYLKLSRASKLIVVADSNIFKMYFELPCFTDVFKEVILIEPSEALKNLDTVGNLIKECAAKGLSRSGCLIGIGGGIIGDIVGFLSSIYMRGIDYIYVPTSLMSQADTIMQKVAVSVGNVKNAAGSFHSPNLTYINTSLLKTLPLVQVKEGLTECVKHAFLDSNEHINLLESSLNNIGLNNHESWNWEEIIYKSLQTKKKFIEPDPFDTIKFHKAVSWGHTFANALESLFNFTIGHGCAVANGMLLSSYIANERGILENEVQVKVQNLVNQLELPKLKLNGHDYNKIIKSLQTDKISSSGEINIVILTKIGEFDILKDVSVQEIYQALEFLYQ